MLKVPEIGTIKLGIVYEHTTIFIGKRFPELEEKRESVFARVNEKKNYFFIKGVSKHC